MDIEKILERLSEITGAHSQKEMAEIIDMKPGNFSAKKISGTLITDIILWGIKEKKNLNYLIYGEKNDVQKLNYEIVKKIDEWLDDVNRTNPDFSVWFKVQFESKFPEYIEWKKRKEGTAGQNNLSALSKIANDNSK